MVPLLVEETTTKMIAGILDADPVMLVWWATETEGDPGFLEMVTLDDRLGEAAERDGLVLVDTGGGFGP